MPDSASFQVKGLENIRRGLDPAWVLGRPMRKFFKTAVNAIANKVRRRTPSDLGDLRRSIETAVDGATIPLWGRVFTARVPLAFYVEYGTGLFAEGPGPTKGVRFFPPPAALDPWAQRHGVDGGGRAVAYFIWKRGGNPAAYFMRDGFEDAKTDVQVKLRQAQSEIESDWNSRAGVAGSIDVEASG